MTALAIVVVLAMPLAGVLALLWLAGVLHERREQVVSQQIKLTDAIHAALGPVIAPVVRRGRGGWVGVLPVPLGHPDVRLMVEIARAQLGPTAEIVLVPKPAAVPSRRTPIPAVRAA